MPSKKPVLRFRGESNGVEWMGILSGKGVFRGPRRKRVSPGGKADVRQLTMIAIKVGVGVLQGKLEAGLPDRGWTAR
jgi:hypothetical protein